MSLNFLTILGSFVLALGCAQLTEHASWAIPQSGHLGTDYPTLYDLVVTPYFETQGIEGSFVGVDGVKIAYRNFEVPAEQETAAVILIPGKGESIRKYAEVIYDLRDHGYSIYALAHRGQGESGRQTEDSQMVYVEDFGHYVQDLATYIDTVVKPRAHRKLYFLAHSMGGAIATLYLETHPKVIDRAALVSPMYEINGGAFPGFAAYGISRLACALGQEKKYAFTQGPYKEKPFEENKFTLCSERYNYHAQMLRKNPSLIGSGVSFGWVRAAMDADRYLLRHVDRVKTPVLIFQAGRDKIVKTEAQNDFCGSASDCTLLTQGFEDSFHEILMERDGIRDLAFKEILAFFSK